MFRKLYRNPIVLFRLLPFGGLLSNGKRRNMFDKLSFIGNLPLGLLSKHYINLFGWNVEQYPRRVQFMHTKLHILVVSRRLGNVFRFLRRRQSNSDGVL